MKKFKFLAVTTLLIAFGSASICFADGDTQDLNSNEFAVSNSKEVQEINMDRSTRTAPYASNPSYTQGGDQSRYSTRAGWSRSSYGYGGGYGGYGYGGYFGGSGQRSSDIQSSGYTAPSSRR